MPTDSDSKSPSDSQKSRQGWLARCGIVIPSISVRDRQTSQEDPNRPVMSPADLRDKKRKRITSPGARTRAPFRMAHNNTKGGPRLPPDPNAVKIRLDLYLDQEASKEEEAYEKARRDLLKKEELTAWDRDQTENRTEQEENVDAIIRIIREYERKYIFGNNPSEAIPGPETLDMGGQFLTNKVRIESRSKLFEIAKMVPKGALLHLHFNAELHPERLIEMARGQDNMYIRSIRPLLSEEDLAETEVVFNVLDENQVEEADLFSPKYLGTATNWKQDEYKWKIWMKWTDFQKVFQDKFPGLYKQQPKDTAQNGNPRHCAEPGFMTLNPVENWVKQKLVLSEKEAYDPTQTVNGVWARFNQATRGFKGLLNYEKVYKWYIGEAIDRMIDEKVMYAELRPMLLDKSIPSDDGKRQIDNAGQMRLILEAVEEKKKELAKKADDYEKFEFGLKIVYCTPRSIPHKTMRQEIYHCIDLKAEFPDLICGFDLVGAEDRPNHIGAYGPMLRAFQRACREENMDIPFLFHAGETLLDTGGSTDPNNSNLYDSVLLDTKRIGHGFSLLKHPHLIEKFKMAEKEPPKTRGERVTRGTSNEDEIPKPKQRVKGSGICVELCPISNELLHLCRNIKEHPFPELLAAGIPCCVNSDNPSLFSNSMSHEFYQIMVGAPTISLFSWKQLALWSIEYSCLSADEKMKAEGYFLTKWKQFLTDVEKEYQSLVMDGAINEEVAEEQYKRMQG